MRPAQQPVPREALLEHVGLRLVLDGGEDVGGRAIELPREHLVHAGARERGAPGLLGAVITGLEEVRIAKQRKSLPGGVACGNAFQGLDGARGVAGRQEPARRLEMLEGTAGRVGRRHALL